MRADDPVVSLSGIGPALADKLANLGIRRVADLLWHRPLRYEDRTRVASLASLRPGINALIVARIEHAEVRRTRRRSLLVSVTDGGGRLRLRFFHFNDRQLLGLQVGAWVRAFGEVRAGPHGLEMVHPEYRVVADRAAGERVAPTLTPVYPTTQGVTQTRLRNLVAQALKGLERPGFLPELLPGEILNDGGAGGDLPGLHDALRTLHAPSPEEDPATLAAGTHPAVRRLAFEEMVARQASLRARRQALQTRRAPPLKPDGALLRDFYAALGFELTAAQRRVIGELLTDLARGRPMLRLVQGDVGSGKTVVAAAAAITAVEAGWQTAFMAPTELLAEQHYTNLSAWLAPLKIPVWLLTGRKAAADVAAALAAGEPGVAVGTHALFQEAAIFGRLGLTVVDEQHRFGVHQRLALRDKGGDPDSTPHQLIMTATPIPRTLAMSAYADLDTSVIDELPPGRTPVTTVAVPDSRRDQVIKRIAAACAAGRQAYWVCTLIEESEVLAARAAEATAEELAQALPSVHVGLTHGRMKAQAKEKAMRAFKEGKIDLLVATTVIEVGVDVPNASLMVIENAERLGLAQLHQLRGRVGRGDVESHCVLLYQPPLGEVARRRLAVLRETTDGFAIAREDLKLRGPGEILGRRQSGAVEFRVADLLRDADLAPAAQAAADRLLSAHPETVEALSARWLGDEQRYADA